MKLETVPGFGVFVAYENRSWAVLFLCFLLTWELGDR